MKEPTLEEKIRLQGLWRPLVNPHQSVPLAAFIGGGAYLHEGEIERAQGGLLMLDEMLEFNPEILECLRGPMTGESLRLARGAHHREVESAFQVVATTNLCLCGKWTPLKTEVGCRFSRMRCTRYLERLSGPLLDRFGLLLFVNRSVARHTDGLDILQRIALTQKFLGACVFTPESALISEHYQHLSARRKNFLRRIAQIYAVERELNSKKSEVLPGKLPITPQFQDYTKAEGWALKPFEQLEKGMS